MDLQNLTLKLTEIKEKIANMIERINNETRGESFYARIITKNEKFVGLINKLSVKDYYLIFEITEEKLVNEKIVKKTKKKKIELEKIAAIEAYKTISGRPIVLL